jgi:malate dehydrogenase (oxaloacetate-decarboxylating)(NADP+)
MFSTAARALVREVSDESLAQGSLFPPLGEIRRVSVEIAVAVAEVAYQEGLASRPRPADLRQALRDSMYDADYPDYV